MNFKEWYKKWRKEDYDDGKPRSGELQIGWNACKEEILRIIFLNTKVNGVHKVDIEKVIEEIEKL